MQMAMQMQDLKKQTGIELNRDLVLGGFKGMAKDSLDPREYQKIQERGSRLVASIVNEKVKSKVEQAAKGGKYQKQGDLYYKVGNAGSGANLAKGQSVMVRLNVMDTKRNEVIPGLKGQATPWVVGDGQLPVLDKVLPMMKVGSTYEVVASPMQAFGPQTPPMINTSEPVIITVEVVSLADSAAMNAAAAPAPAPGQAAPAQAAPAPAAAPAK